MRSGREPESRGRRGQLRSGLVHPFDLTGHLVLCRHRRQVGEVVHTDLSPVVDGRACVVAERRPADEEGEGTSVNGVRIPPRGRVEVGVEVMEQPAAGDI